MVFRWFNVLYADLGWFNNTLKWLLQVVDHFNFVDKFTEIFAWFFDTLLIIFLIFGTFFLKFFNKCILLSLALLYLLWDIIDELL